MKIYASVDLRRGAVVQLVGGDPADERIRLPDPATITRHWLDAGFRHFHVVDLDGALGDGWNGPGIRAIAAELAATGSHGGSAPPTVLQVGGGIRGDEAIDRTLAFGADRAIAGTRAVEDRAWLEAAAAARPGRLVVAADVKDGVVVTRGWRRDSAHTAAAFLATLHDLPLAAVLVTDVAREGRQEGIDGALFARLAAATPHPLLAAGGVTTLDDLRTLRDAGVTGAVLGMALYTGRIDPAGALKLEEE